MNAPATPTPSRYAGLSGRGVLITGGATGIGASLVAHFAAQGSRVGFIDIAQDAGLALADALSGAAHPPVFACADLTDIAALQDAIARLRGTIGPITVLMNNAANDQRHSVAEVTPPSWDAGIAVNLKHQFFAAQAVVGDMREAGGGSIVNFGSVSWMLKMGGMPVYTTAKAAVQGLTRSLAREFGPWRIRVNTLVPGWVMTERQQRLWFTEGSREQIARGQCIDELIQPHHVATLALFLASDDSAMCTAQDFIVDGGWA
jgi:NAD(P)-dependent dehydrogenase (short-subunit alcohol dehydrogenase family)